MLLEYNYAMQIIPMKTKYFALIGIVAFIFIIYNVGLDSIASVIVSMNPFFLLLSLALCVVSIMIKALKWKLVIRANNMDYGILESTAAWLSGFFASLLTPGRLGDLARGLYLKEKYGSLGKSLSTVVVDRIIDVALSFALGAAAVVMFAAMFNRQIFDILVLAAAGALIAAAFYAFTRKNLVKTLLRPLVKAVIPESRMHGARAAMDDFYSSLGVMGKKRRKIALAVAVGVAGWVVDIISVWFLALALSIDVSLLFFFIVLPLINIVEIIPVSVSGIGTRDAACIFLFSAVGIGSGSAVAFSLMYMVFGLWIFGLIGGIIFLKRPVSLSISGTTNKQ